MWIYSFQILRVPRGETLLVDFEINCKMVHVYELEDGSLFEEPQVSCWFQEVVYLEHH